MMLRRLSLCCIIALSIIAQTTSAQRFNAGIDSSLFIKDTLRPFIKKFEKLNFSGYLQPQFQIASQKGINSFSGGNFDPNVSKRFILRRGRFKAEFHSDDKNGFKVAEYSFQIDATEKKIFINEANVTVFESKWKFFSLSGGMMERPFGYELTLSSSRQEADERGRMSQILMNGEVDLGATISFENKDGKGFGKYIKVESGFFNGQGLTGPKDYDNYKDFISRLTFKPIPLTNKINISGGLSLFEGGLAGGTKYINRVSNSGNIKLFKVDSSVSNVGKKNSRQYKGADVQLKINHKWGATEFRAEYWQGTQTATGGSTSTPGELAMEPLYIRDFNGAFFYLLQSIINKKHQLAIKYDFYDPNTKIKGTEIGSNGTNFAAADIRYSTVGAGYSYYINDNVKILLWYSFIKNEITSIPAYSIDNRDNVFTCRIQFRF
jgi:hypothetical protein